MSVLNSEQMVQYTVQTSADVVFETEPGAYIDLFNIPEDGPSYTELGVVSPPSQSDTEAYNTWAESYRDAYYEYLVEIGAAEAYDVTLDQITEAERDAYTEDQKQFLEN